MPQQRSKIVKEIKEETGIDEAMVHSLVHRFYDRIRQDEFLGPIFDARISDWDLHLSKMCDFWSSVSLMSGRYSGQPMVKHAALPVSGEHFDRWLSLFEETAHDVCPPAAAAFFIDRARRIAQSLELGIAGARGTMLGRGERLKAET